MKVMKALSDPREINYYLKDGKNISLFPAVGKNIDTGVKKSPKSWSVSTDFLISGGEQPVRHKEIFLIFLYL